MKFFKTLLLPLLTMTAMIISSCSDDEPKSNTQAMSIQSSLNYISVYDLQTKEQNIFSGANFLVVVNLDNRTFQLTVNDLQYLTDQRAISFTLPEMKMNITQSGWQIRHDDKMHLETSNTAITVSNYAVDFALRADGSQNLVSIKFTIDNRYEITTFFTHSQYLGTTKSTDITNPETEPFSTNASGYLVILDDKTKTVEVQIASPKFLDKMPSNLGIMVFSNIPVTYTKDGYSFKIDKLTPKIGEDPYPAFEITSLEGKVVAGKTLNLDFDCLRFNRTVTFEGTIY